MSSSAPVPRVSRGTSRWLTHHRSGVRTASRGVSCWVRPTSCYDAQRSDLVTFLVKHRTLAGRCILGAVSTQRAVRDLSLAPHAGIVPADQSPCSTVQQRRVHVKRHELGEATRDARQRGAHGTKYVDATSRQPSKGQLLCGWDGEVAMFAVKLSSRRSAFAATMRWDSRNGYRDRDCEVHKLAHPPTPRLSALARTRVPVRPDLVSRETLRPPELEPDVVSCPLVYERHVDNQ